MLRGFKKVRCPHCGHVFIMADIEDNATAESMPVHCTKCGQEVRLNHLRDIVVRLLQDWKWRKPQHWLMNRPYVADPFLNYSD